MMKIQTPSYLFDEKAFHDRVRLVTDALPGIPVCYAMKSNAFLLHCLPDSIRRVEVCSPGELEICKRLQIPGERIIYSGVLKEASDTVEAIRYGAGILTAESPSQFELVKQQAIASGKQIDVILRLTSGNQFGMNAEDIEKILDENRSAWQTEDETNVRLIGIHFYSGTQKKKVKQIQKDLSILTDLLVHLADHLDYHPQIVEYGPGLAASYFGADVAELERAEEAHLAEAAPLLNEFASKWPLSIELGRFLASPAGTFYTKVRDIKQNDDTTYVITDGGIHHLKYYGQMMSMQVPAIKVLPDKISDDSAGVDRKSYCLCGSLCTVADVLVREAELPELHIGDVLTFARCGAYSVTEASALFLSRPLPYVYMSRINEDHLTELRGSLGTEIWNA